MTSFVIADTACCCCFGLTNHSEAASLWLVRQDRATINSGSPPSCSANFCSDRWLHRPRWVGWPVRYLDIYLFYVYGSHSVSCHLAEVTCLPLPQPKLVLDLAMQGWVDLVTAVKVQSPYPRLHITVAFAINSGLRWDSWLWLSELVCLWCSDMNDVCCENCQFASSSHVCEFEQESACLAETTCRSVMVSSDRDWVLCLSVSHYRSLLVKWTFVYICFTFMVFFGFAVTVENLHD